MMAWGIGPGDAVFCPSFTYTATAEAVAFLRATPVFVDVDPDTYTICPKSLSAAYEAVIKDGKLKPKAIIAVDLFGQSADYPAISELAKRFDLKLIADNAQATGCRLDGKSPAHWADIATTSFFPAKPLGCYGDGGAVLTNDADLTAQIRSLAFHGRGTQAYDHTDIGINSRLDTIQAAILLEKLKIYTSEIKTRNEIADRYSKGLSSNTCKTPTVIAGGLSTWAQYTIEVEDRDGLMAHLKNLGIPAAAYYPKPIHLQTAYTSFQMPYNNLPVTETLMKNVMSLPMHAYLTRAHQDEVIGAVTSFSL